MGRRGGRQRLRELIQRYRREVRADLMSEYGVDLATWYAAGRWVALLDYIDMLPAACRLNEAIANDPEAARELARLPKPEGEWSPRASEFDLQAHMTRAMIHELMQIKQAVIASGGGKPGQEKPFPAPRTAIDEAIESLEREWAEDFVTKWGFSASDI